MATVTLRSAVNRALTSTEIDANFDNLNTGKVEAATPVFTGLVTLPSQDIDMTDSSLPDIAPSLNLDFANGQQLDSRVTFGRGSAGTYYDGKSVAKAEENLLLWSQDFSQFGSITGGTFTSPIKTYNYMAAPDGTTTACRLQATCGSTINDYSSVRQYLTNTPSGPNYTSSIYVISNTGSSQTFSLYVNSGAATVTATTSWTRVFITATNLINAYDIGLRGTFTGTSLDISIWGAQLEQRSSVTAYTPTTTAPITNYIPVLLSAPLNTPRFDHDSRPAFYGTCTVSGSAVTLPTTFADGSSPSTVNKFYSGSITISGTAYPITNYVGSTRVVTVTGSPTAGAFSLVNKNYGQSLGLLIEEARENKLLYSANFTNWNTNTNVDIVQNCIIAPDGTLTGTKFISNSVNSTHFTYINATGIVANTYYTYSFYAKKGETNIITIYTNNTFNAFNYSYTAFNLDTGTASILATGSTTNTYSITPVGDGWYRCTVTDKTMSTSIGTARTYFYPSADNAVYTGNGYSGIYIWGAQLEVGSFATSHIPTPSNATVTRFADSASMTGSNFSSWYNQGEGTMYAKLTSNVPDNSAGTGVFYVNSIVTFNISGGVGFGLTISNSSSRVYRLGFSNSNSVFIDTPDNAVPQYVESNVIGAYTATTSVASITANGNTVVTGTVPIIAACTYFRIMPSLSGHIRKLTYYPKALTSSQLKGLTK